MSLSNTAVPKYYSLFRDSVIKGETPVNENVSLQMQRIDKLIADPAMYYDDRAVEGFIYFCETEMTLRDGSAVKMLDSFKLWAEDALSWFYFEEKDVPIVDPVTQGTRIIRVRKKKRLCNKQYLVVGRGAAKSMYASYMHMYMLIMDDATTQQINVAPTLEMADEVLAPIRTAITKAPGVILQYLTEGNLQSTSNTALKPKVYSSKAGIENKMTESIIKPKPLSIDKLQGLNIKLATLDEWRSGQLRENPIGAIEQGAAKIEGYLIIAISSEGTCRNGAGDTIGIELMKILRGEYIDPHTSIWWYRLDSVEEVGNPAMWLKANPNIAALNQWEAYQRDVERAEAVPSERNDILAKRFGLPMEGFTYYFTYEETIPTLNPNEDQRFRGCPCAVGADLSRGDDFCSFSFLFPLPTHVDSRGLHLTPFGWTSINYISEKTLLSLSPAMREKYDEFLAEGSLRVMPGITLEMQDVYDDLSNYIQSQGYDVRCFGYDPYNAETFVQRWGAEYGPWQIEKVIQGKRTESVPLGEIKKISGERLYVFSQSVISFSMGNAVVAVDINANKQLTKIRDDEKIDVVASMMDAYISYKKFKEYFD